MPLAKPVAGCTARRSYTIALSLAVVNKHQYNSGMLDIAKLKRLREKIGLSQAEAARQAGLTRQRLNDIESGRCANVTVDTLDVLAGVLRCKAKDLLK